MSARHSVQRTLASVASAAAVFVWVGCLGGSADEARDARGAAAGHTAEVSSPQAGTPVIRGCRDRVEGGRLVPKRGRDTVIGPVAFAYLPGNYRQAARPDSRRSPPPAGFNAHPIKALALIRSATRVTLSVPGAQRSWVQLLYDPSAPLQGSLRVTLQACRRRASPAGQRAECGWQPRTACRSRHTQFNGAIYIDFDHAPNRGRCAQLVLQIENRQSPLKQRLFQPKLRTCT